MASLPVSHDELDFSDALSVTCSFIDPFYYLDYKGTNSRFLAYVRRQGHVVTLVTKKEGLMTSLTDFHPGTLVLCFEVKTIIGLAFCCLSPLTRTVVTLVVKIEELMASLRDFLFWNSLA